MIYENDLNLVPSGVPLMIKLSQYDKTMPTLKFNLYNGAEVFNVPTGCNVYVQGTKADKTGFSYVCTVNNNEVSVAVSEQMTVFAGRVPCELVITKSGERKGSANFFLDIEACALADDTVISETDIPILQQMPELVARAEAAADEAEGLVGDVVDVKAEVNDIFNTYGSKNLLPYPYVDTTKTHNVVVWTDNGDGTVTANGTASGNSQFLACSNLENVLERGKKYILSGCIGGSNTTYSLYMDVYTTGFTKVVENFNGDTEFTMPNSGTVRLLLIVRNGATVSNLTFKPMIRLESVTDDTYQPYAMTNRELTEDMQAIECDKTTAGTYTLQCVVDSSGNKTYSWV